MIRFIGKVFKFIIIFAVVTALLAAAILGYARYIEPNRLTSTQLNYTSSAVSKPVTVAIFADTHFGLFYDLKQFQKVVDRVNENPPDILIFAGDLIDNLDEYGGDTSLISQKLGEMKANAGKYAVFGNHDYGGGAEHHYENIMNAGGFTVLVNKMVPFYEFNLRLIGIDDLLIGYGNPDIAFKASSNMYNFAVCHEPDVVNKIQGSAVNYMTAGHTHGGQIRIPLYTEKFLPSYGEDYIKGEYRVNDTTLYVNSGLGTTKLPARFRSVPELTYITITPN